MQDSDLQEKLKKLLRLSSSPNQHEAQLALEKAQELAMKYGYSLKDLTDSTEDQVLNVPVDDESGNKTVSDTSFAIAHCLAEYFRVKIYTSTTKWKRDRKGKLARETQVIKAIGLPNDVTAFILAFQFTLGAFETLWKIYNKANPSKYPIRVRNDYRYGFVAGCRERLKAQTSEFGLMVVAPDAVMRVYNALFPVIVPKVPDFYKNGKPKRKPQPRYSTSRSAGDDDAYYAGKKDGRTLSRNTLTE
jgi:hypothetical protein